MRRTLPAFFVALGMLALSASGCPIWIDEHGSGGTAVCIGEHCSCRHHADCDPGEACVSGECVPTGNCFYEPCPSGYVCDTWGTCVPEATVTCDEDVDCDVGYCDLASGTCVHTGLCTTDDDGLGYGGSFVCNDRGVCTPDRGPCPDGTCGGRDGEYGRPGGADWLCEATVRVSAGAVRLLTTRCPSGAVCVNRCAAPRPAFLPPGRSATDAPRTTRTAAGSPPGSARAACASTATASRPARARRNAARSRPAGARCACRRSIASPPAPRATARAASPALTASAGCPAPPTSTARAAIRSCTAGKAPAAPRTRSRTSATGGRLLPR